MTCILYHVEYYETREPHIFFEAKLVFIFVEQLMRNIEQLDAEKDTLSMAYQW